MDDSEGAKKSLLEEKILRWTPMFIHDLDDFSKKHSRLCRVYIIAEISFSYLVDIISWHRTTALDDCLIDEELLFTLHQMYHLFIANK